MVGEGQGKRGKREMKDRENGLLAGGRSSLADGRGLEYNRIRIENGRGPVLAIGDANRAVEDRFSLPIFLSFFFFLFSFWFTEF